MYVIGTAGHVDHGKSTLVEALTGMDPDRLAEEKEREMTIDLGFTWLTLGDESHAEEVGVIDVPGHRDFIENMLAGVGGIDLALLVIAADEGVMPQTKEHLAILDLLEIRQGIVALTKADLAADDPDWLEMVTLDVQETLAGTVLAQAPILPISAKTGVGITALKTAVHEHLRALPPRPDNGRARLPIDRIFTLSGFGTVVTGTLLDGRFQVGDAIEIQPGNLKGRIRGLQTHKTKRNAAYPGSRVAINLTGLDRDSLKRGNVVAMPDTLRSTILLDTAYRHLPDADAPLKHNMQLKLFVGASEVVVRARVLGAEQIEPGQTGWLQLACTEPIAVRRGDHYILRRPSPGATLGGGKVLDPHPGRRHRRFRPETVTRLQTLTQGTPEELLLQALQRIEPASESQLLAAANMEADAAAANLHTLLNSGQIIRLDNQLLSRPGYQRLTDTLSGLLAAHHRQYPLRLGLPREEARSRLKLKTAVFNPLINYAAADGLLAEEGALLRQPDHAVRFTAVQQTAVDQLLAEMAEAGINSPSVKECKTAVGDDLYFALVDLGQLRPISSDVVYAAAQYESIIGQLQEILLRHGRLNAAQVRDEFQTSRKYAIALLEHLDEQKITRRVGDERVLLS